MGVHRQGERGRTAIACEDPQHLAELSVVGAAAAELGREAGTQYAMLLQCNIVLSDEQILSVAERGTGGKFGTQPMHKGDEITRHGWSL